MTTKRFEGATMTDQAQDGVRVSWPLCRLASRGCRGIVVSPNKECWEHLAPRQWSKALSRLRPGSPLDMRGTRLTSEILGEILARLQPSEDVVRFGVAQFDHARFCGATEFDHAEFGGPARFDHAEFSGPVRFERVKFLRGAGFGGASFLGSARFANTTFSGPARFPGASFSGPAWFGGVEFLGSARFDESSFSGETGFSRAEFSGTARFSEARFEGPVQIGEASFSGDAHFNGATFARAQRLGPLVVRGHLDLEEANFAGRLELEATASSMACVRTHFSDRVVFRLGGGHIALEGVEFPRPARLEPQQAEQQFRLVSLRRTDASNLVVAGADLKACQFAGAHNLDKLRIEGANSFASTPEGWKRGPIVGCGPPLWRWTRRQTLAEEHRLRVERPRRWLGQRTPYPALAAKQRDWYPPISRPPDWLTTEELPPDDELINLYRSLRKAREDGKDEPGAADFYYGEMELRRLADHTPWAERFILTTYWLVSGYGLRGLRALIALATVILGVATLLYHVGFKGVSPSSNWWDSVLYATKATLSLPGTEQLTGWGEVIRIVLRLTGPVLLGLALLSVRNRVKR